MMASAAYSELPDADYGSLKAASEVFYLICFRIVH